MLRGFSAKGRNVLLILANANDVDADNDGGIKSESADEMEKKFK